MKLKVSADEADQIASKLDGKAADFKGCLDELSKRVDRDVENPQVWAGDSAHNFKTNVWPGYANIFNQLVSVIEEIATNLHNSATTIRNAEHTN